jgi:hypothetical protein
MAEAPNDDGKKYYLLFGTKIPLGTNGGSMTDKLWRKLSDDFNRKWPRIRQEALRKIRKDGAEFVMIENTQAQAILFATASKTLAEELVKNHLLRIMPLADRADYDRQVAFYSQPPKPDGKAPAP